MILMAISKTKHWGWTNAYLIISKAVPECKGRLEHVDWVHVHGTTLREMGAFQKPLQARPSDYHMPAVAPPESRRHSGRRTNNLHVGQALSVCLLPERPGGGSGLPLADSLVDILEYQVHQVIERWVTKLAAKTDFSAIHVSIFLVGRRGDSIVSRVIGLDEYPPLFLSPARSAGNLAKQAERSFRRPEVGQMKSYIGQDHPHNGHPGNIQALGNHLRTH